MKMLSGEDGGHSLSDNLSSIIPYATLRMHNIARLSNEECVNAIANHLRSNDKFMQDDPEMEQFRMETVRTIPQCLTVKRAVKSQLQATVNQKTIKRSISCWKLFKYNISLKFAKVILISPNPLSLQNWNLNSFFYIDSGDSAEPFIDNEIMAPNDKNHRKSPWKWYSDILQILKMVILS